MNDTQTQVMLKIRKFKEKEVVQKNNIKCRACKQEFQVKGNVFKLNKSIQKQIDDQIFLNDEEINLKQKI